MKEEELNYTMLSQEITFVISILTLFVLSISLTSNPHFLKFVYFYGAVSLQAFDDSAICFFQVFLATDDDAAPVICFLLLEQKKLLSLRLQTVEINNEILYDVKPDMSWSILTIAAAPVIVTRPGYCYICFCFILNG